MAASSAEPESDLSVQITILTTESPQSGDHARDATVPAMTAKYILGGVVWGLGVNSDGDTFKAS